jgi:hypothetical protein
MKEKILFSSILGGLTAYITHAAGKEVVNTVPTYITLGAGLFVILLTLKLLKE